MAFKKVLSQRLLNITKISSQTLTSCRISSSSVQARIPSSPSNPDIAPDPGDNAIFCRFLQKRPVFQPPFFPKLGENLLHKLKEMDIAKSRIRLDGLTPPVEKSESTEAVTVQDARKLLKVAKAVQYLFPAPGANVRKELEEMEKKKAEIDEKANSLVRRELWGGLGFLMVQTAAFMRLTFWELSWDVMEPICFYVTSIYFMAGYTFFLRTSKEPSFEGYYQSRFSAKQKRLIKLHNFDITRYNELRAASSPESPSPTAFSVMKSHHH